MTTKEAMVRTFEVIGEKLGQLLTSTAGLRLFGGHSPRVTGAQLFAAMGVEVTKIRIVARHSGDAILRYVAEAPLKSFKSNLGWNFDGSSSSSSATPFARGASNSTSALSPIGTEQASTVRPPNRFETMNHKNNKNNNSSQTCWGWDQDRKCYAT